MAFKNLTAQESHIGDSQSILIGGCNHVDPCRNHLVLKIDHAEGIGKSLFETTALLQHRFDGNFFKCRRQQHLFVRTQQRDFLLLQF